MALSLQLGFPSVPRSITNPDVSRKDSLDVEYPLAFLTFIKILNVSFEPETLQEYYKYYVKTWNSINASKQLKNDDIILDRYKDFLRELSLKYTTLEEKQFLSKIDLDDPHDLDIVINLYSKKLQEIVSHYNEKRNNIKFNIPRMKIKGSNFGAKKTIFTTTLEYLKSLDDGKILYDLDSITTNLEIEIEELYDSYPSYFNNTPDIAKYDNKDIDYGLDIFIKSNTQLIKELFPSVSDEMIEWKELDELFDTKRKLTKKQIFTNFYYLSTGNTVTNFLSGKLFDSDKNINTFLNRENPTTASTQMSGYLKTPREKGFFRPINVSLLLVDGKTKEYKINFQNLKPNSLYYFPDPSLIGKNGDVLTFVVDDSFLRKNASSGEAINQPITYPFDTKYYGYVSKIDPNHQKNLDIIFDAGYIANSVKDIYGNIYGLFSTTNKFKSEKATFEPHIISNMLINGYQFFDTTFGEGYTFDYYLFDNTTYRETIRTGLSTNTGGFTSFSPDLIFGAGLFSPYKDLISPTETNIISDTVILEGAFISRWDFFPYVETYSSDLSAFEYLNGEYYYTDLIECGLATSLPLQRALLDPSYPSIIGDLTQTISTSAIDTYDGGRLFDTRYDLNASIIDNNYFVSTEVEEMTEFYSLSDTSDEYSGKIMVKNSSSGSVDTILNTLPYLNVKYSDSIINEIEDSTIKLDLIIDSIFIQTENYLIIDKIVYVDGKFITPSVPSIYITYNSDWCDKLSNRMKVGSYVYYCKLFTDTTALPSPTITVYPEIYRFDTIKFKNEILYNTKSSIFELTNGVELYDSLGIPTMSYNSRNNIFKISFLLKNQNSMPTVCEYDFRISSSIEFISIKSYLMGSSGYSINFETNISSLNFFLSSAPIIINPFELIL